MKNHSARLSKLESQHAPQDAPPRMSDEERLQRMKELSKAIADQAQLMGVTAAEYPAAELPLVIAEVLRNDQP